MTETLIVIPSHLDSFEKKSWKLDSNNAKREMGDGIKRADKSLVRLCSWQYCLRANIKLWWRGRDNERRKPLENTGFQMADSPRALAAFSSKHPASYTS